MGSDLSKDDDTLSLTDGKRIKMKGKNDEMDVAAHMHSQLVG
jgi:hypothetical protein